MLQGSSVIFLPKIITSLETQQTDLAISLNVKNDPIIFFLYIYHTLHLYRSEVIIIEYITLFYCIGYTISSFPVGGCILFSIQTIRLGLIKSQRTFQPQNSSSKYNCSIRILNLTPPIPQSKERKEVARDFPIQVHR